MKVDEYEEDTKPNVQLPDDIKLPTLANGGFDEKGKESFDTYL